MLYARPRKATAPGSTFINPKVDLNQQLVPEEEASSTEDRHHNALSLQLRSAAGLVFT
eukprot:COSAG01_NODE_16489_length_1232_cov_1.987643_1_plen_57_part_01